MTPQHSIPRSRLADYAEMAGTPEASNSADRPTPEGTTSEEPASDPGATPAPESPALEGRTPEGPAPESPEAAVRRRHFATVLGEFRRTAVLVPLGDTTGPDGERGLLTADFNGVRFIHTFSDEQALARYAQARGEAAREWTYQTILGARLLDVAIPAAGVPCGVALDCADEPDGMVFPPVRDVA
jgi:hypothetical protein